MNGWQEFSGATPTQAWIMLWYVGGPKAAHMPTIGQISVHEPGKVWLLGAIYQPLELFSHWQPLPGPPSLDYLERKVA